MTMSTWTHHCSSSGKFAVFQLAEICPACGINNQVESLRHAGFLATPPKKPTITEQGKRKVAALFMPKIKKTDTSEYDNDFYDRHG